MGQQSMEPAKIQVSIGSRFRNEKIQDRKDSYAIHLLDNLLVGISLAQLLFGLWTRKFRQAIQNKTAIQTY